MSYTAKHFGIKELVCKHIHDKFGDKSWQFLDSRIQELIDWVRDGTGKSVMINNWAKGGKYSQRGVRCNLCELVSSKTKAGKLYMTAHSQGTAVDFDVAGMTAKEARQWIINNKHRLPYPIRLEDDVTWVHMDLRNDGTNGKVILFKG